MRVRLVIIGTYKSDIRIKRKTENFRHLKKYAREDIEYGSYESAKSCIADAG